MHSCLNVSDKHDMRTWSERELSAICVGKLWQRVLLDIYDLLETV
jgi:hypothetical protein